MKLAMSAFMPGVFCHYCKKEGHMVRNCPKLKDKNNRKGNGGNNGGKGAPSGKGYKGASQRFTGNCNYCGKSGHKEADCWDKPGNGAKRPAWYKKVVEQRETGSAAVGQGDESRVEYMMAGIDSAPDGIESQCSPVVRSHWTVRTVNHPRAYVKCYDSNDDSDDEQCDVDDTVVEDDGMYRSNRHDDDEDEDDDSDDSMYCLECLDSTNESSEMDPDGKNELEVTQMMETGCMAVEHAFPDSQKLLQHPNF